MSFLQSASGASSASSSSAASASTTSQTSKTGNSTVQKAATTGQTTLEQNVKTGKAVVVSAQRPAPMASAAAEVAVAPARSAWDEFEELVTAQKGLMGNQLMHWDTLILNHEVASHKNESRIDKAALNNMRSQYLVLQASYEGFSKMITNIKNWRKEGEDKGQQMLAKWKAGMAKKNGSV
jgi:hypothetical protein